MDGTRADELNGPHEVEIEDNPGSQPIRTGASGDPDVDSSLELIIATFPDEAAAVAAYEELLEAEKEGMLLMIDVAVVNRDYQNKLHIKEEHDLKARGGALFGGGIGTIMGFIGGPLGLLVGGAAGAAVGAAAAEGSDAGMFDEKLKDLGDSLKPGASMVIVAIAHYWSALASAFLTRAGGEATTILLTDDLARQLDIEEAESNRSELK
ncbi:MAG: DUF1269 domain-containing protein [Chloroflexota bacterium]